MDLPKVKKKVNGFLLNEDGKISKQAAVTVGGALGVFVGSSLIDFSFADSIKHSPKADCDPVVKGNSDSSGHCWAHNNNIINDFKQDAVKSQHQHHYNHTSHSSHGSY
ncbi:MAG: hypothetical protein ACQESF_00100 [Nanobdellota archaeon]